ncbi:MAG: hypothetical protein ACPGXZ_10895, partial [Saprospiraceae bacterium]
MKSKAIIFLSLFTTIFFSCESINTTPIKISDNFIPCGWMDCAGLDASTVLFDNSWKETAKVGSTSIKVTFRPCSDGDGTGIYWNNSSAAGCNWGDAPGTDFADNGFTKLSFWAKGEKGGERIKFGIGGIKKTTKLYKDSLDEFEVASLTKNWKKYTIDISDQNLHSVIGGFYWYASFIENPKETTFYLDE